MISTDLEISSRAALVLRSQYEACSAPLEGEALCRQLLETIDDQTFPGALVPTQTADGEFLVVALASPSDWRRLCPVLRAFAGPTLTSFDGLPCSGLHSNSLITAVPGMENCVAAEIRIPSDPGSRDMALRALVRLRDTFARAPNLTRAAPEPTSWLLVKFQDHLNVGRRDAAAAVVNQLRDELRLDALNLKFLQVELFAAFGEWRAIVDLPGFANLTRARRTPAVTALLLEALYQVHLATSFDAGDRISVEGLYERELKPLATPLLKTPLPASLLSGGWRLAALEALGSNGREDLKKAVGSCSSDLGWLTGLLVPQDETRSRPQAMMDETDNARDRLMASETTESIDVMSAALTALARLSEKQRAELVRAEPFRSALRGLEQEAGGAVVPTSWSNWLARISDPSFTNALSLARMGAEEWPIVGPNSDPTEAVALVHALNKAQNEPLAAERTAQALPYIVAALRRDPQFPNPTVVGVYASLLTLLALDDARGSTVYDSSLALVEALLNIGTDIRAYRELAADVNEIAGDGFGVRMVYWTLEVIESFMRSPAPDAAIREQLVHSLLSRLSPIRARLTFMQEAAVESLSKEFDWKFSSIPGKKEPNGDGLVSRLSGQSIAIYSLVENASRQAKLALESLSRDIDVQCSSDPVGTSQLKAFATNSDLFVIAWAAAKHAATDFIRVHRGSRPLVYAEGKGVSSLLRAIEDFYSARSGEHPNIN